MIKLRNTLLAAAMVVMASCSTPTNIVYFQDVMSGTELYTAPAAQIKIQPNDQLQILVSTSDQRLTDQLNLAMGANTSSSNTDYFYTVDSNGDIQLPRIGNIKVVGLTREQVAELIKARLQSMNLVKDPVVLVTFANLGISVLGEVKSPGRIDIKKDRITILEALAAAGDLTINGLRENIIVMRSNGDKEKVYKIDLTNAQSIYSSPVYYLQQDDVIYVAPNDKTVRNSTTNGNTFQTPAFWMSFVTFLMSVGVLIIK